MGFKEVWGEVREERMDVEMIVDSNSGELSFNL